MQCGTQGQGAHQQRSAGYGCGDQAQEMGGIGPLSGQQQTTGNGTYPGAGGQGCQRPRAATQETTCESRQQFHQSAAQQAIQQGEGEDQLNTPLSLYIAQPGLELPVKGFPGLGLAAANAMQAQQDQGCGNKHQAGQGKGGRCTGSVDQGGAQGGTQDTGDVECGGRQAHSTR